MPRPRRPTKPQVQARGRHAWPAERAGAVPLLGSVSIADARAGREGLGALRRRREELNAARRQFENLLPTLSDPKLTRYF